MIFKNDIKLTILFYLYLQKRSIVDVRLGFKTPLDSIFFIFREAHVKTLLNMYFEIDTPKQCRSESVSLENLNFHKLLQGLSDLEFSEQCERGKQRCI